MVLSFRGLNAQFNLPFIINDEDGYTNLREQPNGKSKIVGKVNKFQVFLAFGEPCEDNPGYDPKNNWVYVKTDDIKGYIYSKNIMMLFKLPELKEKKLTKRGFNNKQATLTDSLIRANDSLVVTMILQPINKQLHQFVIEEGERAWIDGRNDYHGDRVPAIEIRSIEISCKGKKSILQSDKLKDLFDPNDLGVYIGMNGELYIFIGGSGDESQYGIWFSVVNREVKYTCFTNYCW
jgi:hypothetical protein